MLTGKYVSSDTIVDAMFNQYGFSPQDIHDLDIYEHIYDAIGLIGASSALLHKVAIIGISNHHGGLPCDLFSFERSGVRDYTTKKALLWSDDIYYLDSDVQFEYNQYPEIYPETVVVDDHTVSVGYFDPNMVTLQHETPIKFRELVYKITKNAISVGYKTGAVELAYDAFPTEVIDGQLRPLIPDNVKYIKAVKAYVGARIAFFLWMRDKISDKKKEALEQEWDWYVGAAGTAASMPSLDRMEGIKNTRMTLVPDLFHHRNGFRNLGNRRTR